MIVLKMQQQFIKITMGLLAYILTTGGGILLLGRNGTMWFSTGVDNVSWVMEILHSYRI